jgi:hypothetical protein
MLGKILRIDVGMPPSAPGNGGPGPDVSAPVVFARAPRRQRVLRLGGAVVYVRCNENCSLVAGGTLRIARRRVLLRHVNAALVANRRARLLVRLRPRGRRVLRAALRRHRRPKVELRLQASDASGNRSALVRRTVRVRR